MARHTARGLLQKGEILPSGKCHGAQSVPHQRAARHHRPQAPRML